MQSGGPLATREDQPGLCEGAREGRERLSGRGEEEVVRLVTDGHGEKAA